MSVIYAKGRFVPKKTEAEQRNEIIATMQKNWDKCFRMMLGLPKMNGEDDGSKKA